MSRRGRHGLQVPKRKRSGKAAQLGRPVLASLAQLTPEAWRATFERSAIGIALLDTSGHFLATNSAFQETLGYASEELVGRSFVDFAHEEDRPGNVALAQELLEGRWERVQLEKRYRHKDGSVVWTRNNVSLVSADGAPGFFISIVEDITERKRAEEALHLLVDVTTAASAAASTPEMASAVLERICSQRQWQFGQAWWPDAPGRALLCSASSFFADGDFATFRAESLGAPMPLGRGLPGRVWKSKTATWVTDVTRDSNFSRAEAAKTAGFRGAFAFPVTRGQEVLAVFEFFARDIREPDRPFLDVVDKLGQRLGEIVERRQTEQALQQSEEQYRLVVETAADAVVSIVETGQILFVNPAATRVFGYASSELIGQPLTILMPEFMRERHEAGFRRYLETSQRHLNWHGIELIGRRKSGEEFPIEVSFGEIKRTGDHIFTGFIRDISEKKQAEEMRAAAARRSLVRADVSVALAGKEDLKDVLQGCAEAVVRHLDAAFARIWTLDENHDVLELQASAGMYTHLDGPHSRVPVGHLKIGQIARERKALFTNDVLNDPRISDRTWAKNEGIVALAGYPLIVGTRAVGVIAMFSRTPLTTSTLEALASVADTLAQGIDLKRAEQALHRTRADLAHVTRLTTMGEMAASIAHEVNQPLAAVVANANAGLRLLARRQPDLKEVKAALTEIVQDGDRASDVVARVRALVKKTDAERVPLGINDVVQDVLAAIETEMTRHGVVLRTSLSEGLPPVRGDRVQLQQVVLNLTMNAIEAMREVEDRTRELVIGSRPSEVAGALGVAVAVEDTGRGFAAADAERLFEAFYTTKREGLGMGLSISRSIIEAHGGRLSVAHRAGHGAAFTFVLPSVDDPGS